MARENMKYLLIIVSMVVFLIIAGCVGGNQNTPVTPTQKATSTSLDPIVGIWQWTAIDGSKLYTFTFFSDGRYSFTDPSDPNTLLGTWAKVRENEYLITYTNDKTQALLYNPVTDSYTMPEFSFMQVYRLGKEPVRTYTSVQMTTQHIFAPQPSGPTPSWTSQGPVYQGVEQVTENIQLIGSAYGISSNTARGIDEIRFSIGLFPGAPPIDLTKLKIVFSTPNTIPIILTQGTTSSTTIFTTKFGTTAVTSMNANDQVEIDFKTAFVLANSKMTIELRPSVGAALPFSKTAPATISAVNVLY
jgi:archaellin